MGNTPFRPIRGTDISIARLPISDGLVYFATDTGKIYMDKGKIRVTMGGGSANGSSIYFGILNESLPEDLETGYYYYPTDMLENLEAEPRIDDIILDESGALYRILAIEEDTYSCSLLPLSGSGGGGLPSIIRPALTIGEIENSIIINGQNFSVPFVAKSALDENNTPLTSKLTIYWSLVDAGTEQIYYTGVPLTVEHDVDSVLNVGQYLKESTDTIIQLYATGINHDQQSVTRQVSVSTVEMYLQQTSSYNPAYTYNASSTVTLQCNAIGNLSKILELTYDGVVIDTQYLESNATNPRTFAIPSDKATHGYHTIEINLYQNLGDSNEPKKGLPAEPLKYEIAITKVGEETPIIWLGDYKEEYYNYDIIQIPFLVYNPADTSKAIVRLYKNDIEIDSSPRTITDFSTYTYWEIADAELNKNNYYSIACGDTTETTVTREIKFTVVQDPNRDMTIVQKENLQLNFDPAGRSNNEPALKRSSWSYGEGNKKVEAIFENFNWYNNGWYTDPVNKSTFLRISNGAKFTIPFGNLTFGTGDSSKQSNSIEIQFKVRNVQDYSNLIKNITRYTYVKDGDLETNKTPDEDLYTAFLAQNKYINYDAFLQAELTPSEYESLTFSRVQKNINLESVAGGFYSGTDKAAVGFCIGPQDTFFSNGQDTVNVSFVENEMVHLSFVYDHNLRLMFIYINGVITGVIKSNIDQNVGFTINTNDIIFSSDKCDIDLYKVRIYNTNLSVNDIVTNYAVDTKDVLVYDQNGLALENTALKEYQLSFDRIEDYNNEHPENPLMPYIIFDTTLTTDNDKLPYAKANGTTDIHLEFVNAPLDAAYARGELVSYAIKDGLLAQGETDQDIIDEAVKTYYKHHCPSWTSTMSANDTVTIEVQGTSSEFYPRRNFKIKTKYKKENTWGEVEDENGSVVGEGWTEEDCLNIFIHKGPFEEIFEEDKEILRNNPQYYGVEESRMIDGWYMNNYTNPTDRWTMKVDYMESSGSYNAGFASLVGNAYTKHPLNDYIEAGVLDQTDKFKNDVFGDIRWEDFRTSLLGFPVMAFQKKRKIDNPNETEYLFIGYYRMLLDKGSDQVLGFKTPKKITHKLVDNKTLRDVAECWEFSTNARTFCSYKDPWNRVELSFKAPRSEGVNGFIKLEGNKVGGPMVLNHFEPRYFVYEDYLKNDEDGFYNFGNLDQDTVNEICADLGIDPIDVTSSEAMYQAQDAAVDLMKNWEKVCKWIYSTNEDNVRSQGEYVIAPVGLVTYEANKYYIINPNSTGDDDAYILATGEYDSTQIYYSLVTKTTTTTSKDEEGNDVVTTTEFTTYENAYVTTEEYIYQAGKFYTETTAGSKEFVLSNEVEFDSAKDYYKFTSLPDEEIAKIADLLVAPATGTFSSTTQYYTYNSDAKVNPTEGITGAVVAVAEPKQDDFDNGLYYVAAPVSYASTTYKYDTKEYRAAKFMNELSSHFDTEYLATYFVMTEVFECYDSRGKNCMMASWGPQKEGGEYIWYPIFYDIDTQLGINNTGIPSFEFNVDATEAGNYSTSDSILWNNFYKFFKGSHILNKYKNLRGQSSSYPKLDNPPLQSVDYLENWYTFDPDTTKNIANKGDRPLIATNLDMYFKYITITNSKAKDQGVAYLLGNTGEPTIDTEGTYYYALQGDRSQSRRQFLTNRLEYIDSWLNQGNYARGGSNRIRGRISANATDASGTISDKWIETAEDPYWVNGIEFGEKTHDFDSQYWVTLKPIRSSYVTAGDDSANYPSQKYDGINAVDFKLSDIENGIRKSANYPEQLVYIYGMNQMSDYGDMYKLYWTEFYMEGTADHLTSLKLGYDGDSLTDEGVSWYNKEINDIITVPMPLLKEANFSNLGVKNQLNLDLTKSEKLENFRAVGTSNLTGVQLADGVALNTLYLPESVTSLKLIQANLLTNLINEKTPPKPTYNEETKVVENPTEGLFIEGFFTDNFESSINSIHLDGGSLGYGSYLLLKRFYDVKVADVASSANNKITMTDVNWSPYMQLTEGAIYDVDETNYYIDNDHYELVPWEKNAANFDNLILNGKLYLYQGAPEVTIDDSFVEMLLTLDSNKFFSDASSTQTTPIISGIVYVENENPVEESNIRTTIQEKYPNLTIFFKNITKAYSAKFVIKDSETGLESYVKFANGSTVPSIQKISVAQYEEDPSIFFDSPFARKVGDKMYGYAPEKTHYDFRGWSLNPDAVAGGADVITEASGTWDSQTLDPDVFDYTYYAIFEIHSYTITFYNGDNTVLETQILPYGTIGLVDPIEVPYQDDSALDLYSTYGFTGYTDNQLTNKVVNLKTVQVRGNANYYPVFKEINVYDNVNMSYFSATNVGNGNVELTLIKKVKGKITIPAQYTSDGVSGIVYSINESFRSAETINEVSNPKPACGQDLTHVFFEKGTQIKQIKTSAFDGKDQHVSKLIYCEFPDSLTMIDGTAFRNCPLNYSSVAGDPNAVVSAKGLTTLGRGAFQLAFDENWVLDTFKVNSSLKSAATNALLNLRCIPNVLQIGSSTERSQLIFSQSGTVFGFQKPGVTPRVEFYSANYTSPEEVVAAFKSNGFSEISVL